MAGTVPELRRSQGLVAHTIEVITIDLPGRWYMQAIVQLFKENRLANGSFIGLGRCPNLKEISSPVYLLVGESGDITTREQVFDAEKYPGTPKSRIEKKLVPSGNIGLFMASRILKDAWPSIAQWIIARQRLAHPEPARLL